MNELIKIDSNIPEVQRKLGELIRRGERPQPLLKTMGATLELSTRKRWDREEDPTGKKWQALKASTLRRKAKKGKKPQILQEDQKLRDTINSQVQGDTLLVGSPEKYGPIHQLGGDISIRPRGKRRKGGTIHMPARPFLGISSQDEKDLLDDAEKYLALAL